MPSTTTTQTHVQPSPTPTPSPQPQSPGAANTQAAQPTQQRRPEHTPATASATQTPPSSHVRPPQPQSSGPANTQTAQPTSELTAKQVTATLERSAALSKAPANVRKLLAVAFGGKRPPTGPALVVACLTDSAKAKTFLRELKSAANEDAFVLGATVHAMEPAMRGRVWQALVAVGDTESPAPKGADMAVVREVAKALSEARSLDEAITAAISLL